MQLNCQSRNHALSAGGWEVAAGRRVLARGMISRPLPQRILLSENLFDGIAKEVFLMKNITVKEMAVTAVLIAAEVVLTRFLSIQTPVVRIGFGFLPIVIIATLYGPVYAGIAGAMADFLGAILFPIGAYFPGFTLTAFLTGVVYGLFLYKRKPGLKQSFLRVGTAALIVTVVLQLGLDTLWVSIITGSEYTAWLAVRAIRTAFMLPIQIILISLTMASMQLYPVFAGSSADRSK